VVTRQRRQGFTLLESMVVLAILGVVAALALPGMLPMIHKAKLDGAAEIVAGVVVQARTRAMSARRCVRVRLETVAGQPNVVAEELRTFDCDVDPSTAPRTDNTSLGATNLWNEVARARLDTAGISLALNPGASEGLDEWGGPVVYDPVYRATGRLFSSDTNIDDDDVAIELTHAQVAADQNRRYVLLEAHGPVCMLPRGVVPAAGGNANDLDCP
jgi:prepilin-type N-terminal cleavage/methylation domain-containing protein